MVILPVDQGFEHGPARSFAPNPAAYDPDYHVQLAIDSGCNAYAAPLGFLEAVADKYAGADPAHPQAQQLRLARQDRRCRSPRSPCSVKDAVRLGCAAIGYTIYPGSGARNEMYQDLRDLIAEAKAAGLPTIVWAYARGNGVSKENEPAIDVITYGAQIAAELGAHVIKVKPPNEKIPAGRGQEGLREVEDLDPHPHRPHQARGPERLQRQADRDLLRWRGERRDPRGDPRDPRRAAASVDHGPSQFQRPKAESIKLLKDVMKIYPGK